MKSGTLVLELGLQGEGVHLGTWGPSARPVLELRGQLELWPLARWAVSVGGAQVERDRS